MWALLQSLVGYFFNRFRELGAAIAGRIITGLGFGWLSHDVALPSLIDFVSSYATGMGVDVVGFVAYLGVDRAMRMILSAYVASLAVRFLWSRIPGVS